MNEYIMMLKEHDKLMFIKADCYENAIEKARVFESLSDYGISKIVKLHEYKLDDSVIVNREHMCHYYQEKYDLHHVLFATHKYESIGNTTL